MGCSSCVEKLAKRLLKNHPKLDEDTAYKLAEKGIARVENRVKLYTGPRRRGRGTDYTQSCSVTRDHNCSCNVRQATCKSNRTCTCTCDCPTPSDPNSHYTSDTCSPSGVCDCHDSVQSCAADPDCIILGTCACSGVCNYECDAGFTWNGSECVVPVVVEENPLISPPITSPIVVSDPIIRAKSLVKLRVFL